MTRYETTPLEREGTPPGPEPTEPRARHAGHAPATQANDAIGGDLRPKALDEPTIARTSILEKEPPVSDQDGEPLRGPKPGNRVESDRVGP